MPSDWAKKVRHIDRFCRPGDTPCDAPLTGAAPPSTSSGLGARRRDFSDTGGPAGACRESSKRAARRRFHRARGRTIFLILAQEQ